MSEKFVPLDVLISAANSDNDNGKPIGWRKPEAPAPDSRIVVVEPPDRVTSKEKPVKIIKKGKKGGKGPKTLFE